MPARRSLVDWSSCPDCRNPINNRGLLYHMQKHHGIGHSPLQVWVCDVCGFSTDGFNAVAQHCLRQNHCVERARTSVDEARLGVVLAALAKIQEPFDPVAHATDDRLPRKPPRYWKALDPSGNPRKVPTVTRHRPIYPFPKREAASFARAPSPLAEVPGDLGFAVDEGRPESPLKPKLDYWDEEPSPAPLSPLKEAEEVEEEEEEEEEGDQECPQDEEEGDKSLVEEEELEAPEGSLDVKSNVFAERQQERPSSQNMPSKVERPPSPPKPFAVPERPRNPFPDDDESRGASLCPEAGTAVAEAPVPPVKRGRGRPRREGPRPPKAKKGDGFRAEAVSAIRLALPKSVGPNSRSEQAATCEIMENCRHIVVRMIEAGSKYADVSEHLSKLSGRTITSGAVGRFCAKHKLPTPTLGTRRSCRSLVSKSRLDAVVAAAVAAVGDGVSLEALVRHIAVSTNLDISSRLVVASLHRLTPAKSPE